MCSLVASHLGGPDEATAFYGKILEKRERLGPEAALFLDTEVVHLKLKKVRASSTRGSCSEGGGQ